ncbi:MAG: amino acid ABC transporter substrate-binding protein, partial [Methanomicrobiales archaeon]|nr:amino acid ABC transporter substrate-binding protein [Methanomicrobiales archaeon]
MIPFLHPNAKKISLRQVIILLVILSVILLCCCPFATAREVRIAQTELKPTLFTDEQGNPAGFIVDLIEDLAKKEGYDVIWIRGTLSESWDRLSSGEIDLIPAVTVTSERLKMYDFTNESVMSIWSQVYARPDS